MGVSVTSHRDDAKYYVMSSHHDVTSPAGLILIFKIYDNFSSNRTVIA